ncbi:MAG: RNA-metabolising metallo-beta-lactamase [Parcubacteria group bacterium GW2011_GWA2_38_13]|nr:MAG: RNA-metabolising metallo-beta-lactamase [Parcubacteria group bacterium GW2011_GWA2_38_13]
MKIQFFGACDGVTGSQYVLEVNGKKVLLECGFYQGRRADMERINRTFPYDPKSLDAAILSHAHIDHSGNLPNLVKQGFSGKIFCTNATAAMLEPMLMDSAGIQEHDIEYLNRKLKPEQELEPIYTKKDAQEVLGRFVPKAYHEWFEVVPGLKIFFQEAGHILGSALVTMHFEENGKTARFGYSGDLGRKFLPILRDPEQITDVEYLMIESTYGDRTHNDIKSSYDELAKIINETSQRGGKIIIPSFAVERAQELLYIIHELKDRKAIPDIPVYLDSPLAVRIVNIFSEFVELYDDETREHFLSKGENPFIFSKLNLVESSDGSKAINTMFEPSVIIASSGMCEFGRIRHHLKNNIENPNNTIAIVGYQAKDTLGRKLLDGMKEVNILDRRVKVRAQIVVFNSLSAHADQNDLLGFIKRTGARKKIFLVHGEDKSKEALKAKLLEAKISSEIVIPKTGEFFEFV